MEIEDESHLMEGSCPVYGNIRQKYGDLNMEDDIISFFCEVLEERERLDDEERSPGGGEDATAEVYDLQNSVHFIDRTF